MKPQRRKMPVPERIEYQCEVCGRIFGDKIVAEGCCDPANLQ